MMQNQTIWGMLRFGDTLSIVVKPSFALLLLHRYPNRKWGWISWSVKLTYIQFKAKATSISQRIDIGQQRWQTKNSLKCELNRTVKTRTCSDRRTKPPNIPWLRRYQRTVSNLINLEISREHHCNLGWVLSSCYAVTTIHSLRSV